MFTVSKRFEAVSELRVYVLAFAMLSLDLMVG